MKDECRAGSRSSSFRDGVLNDGADSRSSSLRDGVLNDGAESRSSSLHRKVNRICRLTLA
jgi:hypothetical protein